MTHSTLQSLIWPASELCADQALYAHLSGARQRQASLEFDRGDSASFNSYFNLFNLGKWRLHCGLTSLFLELSGHGVFMLEVFLTRANLPDEQLSETEVTLADQSLTQLEIPIPEDVPIESLVHFQLTALTKATVTRADWQTPQVPLRTLELVLSITTFRREAVIKATVARFESYIKTSPYRGRIRLITVDNGQSADLESTADTRVIPNANMGGSGGFARGLIEARKSGASHCLFMDDDAHTHMGSIERTYQMLAYATNPATTIAGALADADDSGRLWENAALFDGTCHGLHRGVDLRDAAAVTRIELGSTRSPCPATPQNIYGGWWYFAFAIDQIKHLPFPFFVRGDDVSFSLAHDFNILTLNGVISFQDSNFTDKESPLTLYLDLRSHLAHLLSLPVLDRGRWQVARIALWFISRALIRCHYDSAAALNLALADVLRGPEFFADNADMTMRRNQISEMTKVEIWKPLEILPPERFRLNPKNPLTRAVMILSINGFLLPFFSRFGNHITLKGQARKQLGSLWGAARITHLDTSANTAYTVTQSKRSALREGLKMLCHVSLLLWRYKRLKTSWRTGYEQLTTDERFWTRKLGLKPSAGRQ